MRFRNLVALAVVCSGCSLVLDTDKQQCTQPADCGLFNEQPLYACVDSYCEPVACATDTECQARGAFVCGMSRTCEPALCARNEECTRPGESCTLGRCVDPLFQCFSQPQPLASSEPAVVRLKLLSYADQKPVTDLKVRVCAIADLACNTPLDVQTSYDEQGMLTIGGLENRARYSIRFTGKDASGMPLLEHEYFMQRPVVGLTPEADKLEMVPESLVNVLASAAGTTWRPEQGLVLAQIFGCDLKPLANVSLTDNRPAGLFYLTGAASTSLTQTDGSGVGGFVNMEVDNAGHAVQHKLSFSYAGRPMFSFLVAPRPHVMTALAIYLGDYGTTVDRAATFTR
jgi:hypothetical protein